jgi:hypothetical protein
MESVGGQGEVPDAPRQTPVGAIVVLFIIVVVTIGVVIAAAGQDPAHTQRASTSGQAPRVSGPTRFDHWHAALGVSDCGQWVPNWPWPAGPTVNGAPARAGTGGSQYAGLHSHDDGLIHIEPLTSDEMGSNATLGLYFHYGGWQLDATSITFFFHARNGDLCDGKAGVLRWAVNGKEQHGDPAAHRILNGDVIELVFTTADAPLPPQREIPSYESLREIIGPQATA